MKDFHPLTSIGIHFLLKAFIDSIADIPELCELKKLLKRHWTKINGLFITEFD